MADYPDLYIDARTYRISITDGSESSRADSGALRIRRLWPEIRVTITVEHPSLTWQEFTDLLQFYMDNRADDQINFRDPNSGQMYLVSMVSPPTHSDMLGSKLYKVRVELEGVMNDNP